MKRKILIIAATLLCALSCAVAFGACSGNGSGSDAHEHKYSWRDNGDGTHSLHCANAGCDNPDKETGKHEFDEKGECICGAKGGHVHVFDRQVPDNRYLIQPATCTGSALYYYSCECGETGENMFEYGEPAPHDFSEQRLSPEYCVTEADCLHRATYRYACSACGMAGGEAYEYGELGDHITVYTPDEKYLDTPATCREQARYWCHCEVCGERGEYKYSDGGYAPHSYTNYVYNDDATCMHDGTETAVCDYDCGERDTRTKADSRVGHSFTQYHDMYDMTCVADGHEISHCDYGCGETDTRVKVGSATGIHIFDDESYVYNGDATCTKDGTETAKCRFCEATDTRTKADSKAHNYVEGHCKWCDAVGTNGLVFSLNGDQNSYRVNKGDATDAHIYIPSEYNGLPVTVVGDFENCQSVTAVTLPVGITRIGLNAFYGCSNLAEINIPDGVTEIDSSAFYECTSLTGITLPASVKTLNGWAFYGCSSLETLTLLGTELTCLASVFNGCSIKTATAHTAVLNVLPGSVETVTITGGEIISGLENYYNLKSVTLPATATEIGENAFRYCNSLSEITLPSTVKTIGKKAFEHSGLTKITLPDGVESIGDDAFNYCENLTRITLPDGVQTIGARAFGNCGFSEITVPDSVISLGDYAFAYCGNLAAVTVGGGIKELGREVFTNTSVTQAYASAAFFALLGEHDLYNLAKAEITGGDAIPAGAFKNKSALTEITVPVSIKSVGADAFSGCEKLVTVRYAGDLVGWCSVAGLSNLMNSKKTLYIGGAALGAQLVIPDTVTDIADGAFGYCSDITSVTLPQGLKSIGDSAFTHCSGITGLTIPDGVKTLGFGAFDFCTELTQVTLGSGIQSMGMDQFVYCNKIEEVRYTGDLAGWCAIEGHGNFITSAYPGSAMKLYIGGELLPYNLVIPDGVTRIGDGAFFGCNIYTLSIPASVTEIGYGAFSNCRKLESVVIPDGVESIGAYAFENCRMVETVKLGSGVKQIGKDAFGLSGQKTVQVDYTGDIKGWLSIEGLGDSSLMTGRRSFTMNGEVTKDIITVPDGVTEIEKYALRMFPEMTDLTIGSSVEYIDEEAFSGISKVKNVTVSADNAAFVSRDGVLYNRAMTEMLYIPVVKEGAVSVPDSVVSVARRVFEGRDGLLYNEHENALYAGGSNSHHILAKVKDTAITSVIIHSDTKVVASSAFRQCYNLSKVYYAGTSEEWASVAVGDENTVLTDAKIYYYSETQPTGAGNFWHYVNGAAVEW